MLNPPTFLAPLLASPVAVLGAGVSGQAAARLVRHLGGTAVIYDQKGGEGTVAEFRPGEHQLVIVSPGFTPSHNWVVDARSAGIVCLAELDFASLFWRGSVVAVTGTNGKTTLTEFLTYALNEADIDAWAVGNIGKAFGDIIVEREGGAPNSIAVCEVSSFQAEMLRHFRADAVIWTNFAEDHLERHGSMQVYFEAKWHLFERAVGGEVFAGSSVQRAAERYGQSLPEAAVIDTEDPAGDILLSGTVFDDQPQRENFLLAAAWWRAAGLREPLLYAAARTFQVGPHRLAQIGERNGVTWWNDSKATNFHATEAALLRFGGPVVLIAGGRSKGGDVAGFVQRIAPRVKQVLLIGETRNILATFFGAAGVPHQVCTDLADAVHAAAALAQAGDHVLLSPGFSSLDTFTGYTERGLQFESLVQALPSATTA
ncbi:UDP-N-acetylmuramoyl-L-alanine--D-glutamate ligase [Actomonas aquatica]|uniref:UDP-N-acetylmuramoylalanine--D-glutamate ligase n=1 Tax=Actomonas aquatica TaxID=2866162 RepID=A0ABZ1CCH8_9BACT|nr:UDP-N-acetylmuramoyl-L-alanine--D-glutamate ligase [Opitutus sp. WL0086]WRQ89105.1 UDP-N-acetylmuramoyl-L-alanine--D-glutamate ligase [Opitutus sp. WL0086]